MDFYLILKVTLILHLFALLQIPYPPPPSQPRENLSPKKDDTVLRFLPQMNVKKDSENPIHKDSVPPPPPIKIQNLTLSMYSFDSLTPVTTWVHEFSQYYHYGNNSVIIYENTVDKLLQSSNCTKEKCFLYVTTESKQAPISEDRPFNFVFFSNFTQIYNKGLKQHPIDDVAVSAVDETTYKVSVKANAIAPFVWLNMKGVSGRFSDNGFHMITATREVYYHTWEKTTLDKVKAGLEYRSLMDMYMAD